MSKLAALDQEREERRLAIMQLDPELLVAAAPEVRDKDRVARKAEAEDVVFDMCDTRTTLPHHTHTRTHRETRTAVATCNLRLRIVCLGTWPLRANGR